VADLRKGFIFSIDALFAAALVIALLGTIYLISTQNVSSEVLGSEFSRLKVTDAATVALYQGNDASDYGLTEFPDQYNTKLISCAEYYSFDPSFSATMLCEEVWE
jgi:hypothetical protein